MNMCEAIYMENVRVIRIPELKVVSSGAITSKEEYDAYNHWCSTIDAKQYITPRDFKWLNDDGKYIECIFAIPENCDEFGGYKLVNFPGGLYAVITVKDTLEDSNSIREGIDKWISESECFEISTRENDIAERYTMSHVITPEIFKMKMGYHLSDIFFPIVVKKK